MLDLRLNPNLKIDFSYEKYKSSWVGIADIWQENDAIINASSIVHVLTQPLQSPLVRIVDLDK